jgi:hypothetical protein
MNVSAGTRCLHNALVQESQCSNEPVCNSNGFFCTSQCSVTYYYCSNGRRYPDQFVPFGTVCSFQSVSYISEGQLVYPDQCLLNYSTALVPYTNRCPTVLLSFQCSVSCGSSFYYCRNFNPYVFQQVPNGLLCHNHTFVLASDPVCSNQSGGHQFPISVNYKNDSIVWSVLSQYALASAVAEALVPVGVYVRPLDIYFVSEYGRRLSDSNKQLMVINSARTELFAYLNVAVLRYLPAALSSRNLQIDIVVDKGYASSAFRVNPLSLSLALTLALDLALLLLSL